MANLLTSPALPHAEQPTPFDPAQRQVQAHLEYKDEHAILKSLLEMDGRNAMVVVDRVVHPASDHEALEKNKRVNKFTGPQLFMHVPGNLPKGEIPLYGTVLLIGDYVQLPSYGGYAMLNNEGYAYVKTSYGTYQLRSTQAKMLKQTLFFDNAKTWSVDVTYLWLPNVQVLYPPKGAKDKPPYTCKEVCAMYGGDCIYDSGTQMHDSFMKKGKKSYQIVCKDGSLHESFGEVNGHRMYYYVGTLEDLWKSTGPEPSVVCKEVCKDYGGDCVFTSGTKMSDSYLKPGQKSYQIVCKNGFVFESFGERDASGRLIYIYAGDLSGLGKEALVDGSQGSSQTPPSGSAGGSLLSSLRKTNAPQLSNLGKFRFRYETVQAGDTLGTFCARNGITRQQFFELNPTKPRINIGNDEYTTPLQEQEECLVEVVF